MLTVGTAVADVAWLDWLADEADAKVELDAEGSIVVSPATDRHVLMANALHRQLSAACPPGTVALLEGLRWSPAGGIRPSYIPDLSVLDRRSTTRPEGVFTLDPPPLLVIEVSSPESRRRDLGEKSVGYFAGGALAYWTIEVPGLTDVEVVTLTVRSRADDDWDTRQVFRGGLAAVADPFPVRLDLDILVR